MNKINDRYSNRMFEVNEFIKFHRSALPYVISLLSGPNCFYASLCE